MAKNSEVPSLETTQPDSAELSSSSSSGLNDPALQVSRSKSNAARASHDAASILVERRQLALVANEARVRAREQSIEQGERKLKEDKKALKKLQADRPAMEKKLAAAKKEAEKAGRQARKQESRYDEAMLRHVVEREKSVDRALHTV